MYSESGEHLPRHVCTAGFPATQCMLIHRENMGTTCHLLHAWDLELHGTLNLPKSLRDVLQAVELRNSGQIPKVSQLTQRPH